MLHVCPFFAVLVDDRRPTTDDHRHWWIEMHSKTTTRCCFLNRGPYHHNWTSLCNKLDCTKPKRKKKIWDKMTSYRKFGKRKIKCNENYPGRKIENCLSLQTWVGQRSLLLDLLDCPAIDFDQTNKRIDQNKNEFPSGISSRRSKTKMNRGISIHFVHNRQLISPLAWMHRRKFFRLIKSALIKTENGVKHHDEQFLIESKQ